MDQILVVLLSTSMFIGGLVAFILDNTVPGKSSILYDAYLFSVSSISTSMSMSIASVTDLEKEITKQSLKVPMVYLELSYISGTDEERGILVWRKSKSSSTKDSQESDELRKCYDFPLGMSLIRKWNWATYIPVCPTFKGCSSGQDDDQDIEEVQVTSSSNDSSATGQELVRHRKSQELNSTRF